MHLIGKEIDLLEHYPKSKRDLSKRLDNKTEEAREIARRFGKEFFDGERQYGYGGFAYNSRFWTPVIPSFDRHWNLSNITSLLDVGCAKGFMLHDIKTAFPNVRVEGVDISQYAISNCIKTMRDNLRVADAVSLPFEDNAFDVVVSINTIHNLDDEKCRIAIREIERVSRKYSFITVDAYRSEAEKERMMAWNLTAKTIKSVQDWKTTFKEEGYSGDFYWFIP